MLPFVMEDRFGPLLRALTCRNIAETWSCAMRNMSSSILSNKHSCLYKMKNLDGNKNKNNSSWCCKHKLELNELTFQGAFST